MKLSVPIVLLSLALFASASPVQKKRLIRTSDDDPGTWMTYSELMELKKSGITFVDVTNDPKFSLKQVEKQPHISAIPDQPRHQALVNNLIDLMSQNRTEQFLHTFTSFFSRHYETSHGSASQKWLLGEGLAALRDYNGSVSAREVDHGYMQHSVVIRLEGSDPLLRNEVVIIGAHQDSINSGGINLTAPGADDDGSGSAVVMEVLRVLTAGNFRAKRSLEFHWYAAEEVGLLGSAAIAENYKENNISVVSMMNLDMTGWQVEGVDDIAIFSDQGNDQLISFLRVLSNEYLAFGNIEKECGYGCSDHASWTRQGFPAAFVAEAVWLDGGGHADGDTVDRIGFGQVMEFVKLGVAYMVEVGDV